MLLDVTVFFDTFVLTYGFLKELIVKPLHRSHVSKAKSAGQFRSNVRTTKAANMSVGPMRGGIRL